MSQLAADLLAGFQIGFALFLIELLHMGAARLGR
jgi:hypothetical protein